MPGRNATESHRSSRLPSPMFAMIRRPIWENDAHATGVRFGRIAAWLLLIFGLLLGAELERARQGAPSIVVVEVDGVITPVIADHVRTRRYLPDPDRAPPFRGRRGSGQITGGRKREPRRGPWRAVVGSATEGTDGGQTETVRQRATLPGGAAALVRGGTDPPAQAGARGVGGRSSGPRCAI